MSIGGKKMRDYIIRATAANGEVRAFCATMTNVVEKARALHELVPVTAAALGRALVAVGIMSKFLKGEKDSITIQFKADGPMRGLVAVTNSKAEVRGYVNNPQVDLPLNSLGKLDVSGALGKHGYLNVIQDYGLKEPYIGFVNLISGEIAEDIAYYYASSEQTPSIVALGVLVHPDGKILHAGGYFIQLMPNASEETILYLERKLSETASITAMMSEGKNPEDILQEILGEKEVKILEKSSTSYQCKCSFERMESNLISLGELELQDIINTQDTSELVCHFCSKKYYFSKDDIKKLLHTLNKSHNQK